MQTDADAVDVASLNSSANSTMAGRQKVACASLSISWGVSSMVYLWLVHGVVNSLMKVARSWLSLAHILREKALDGVLARQLKLVLGYEEAVVHAGQGVFD